MTPPMSYRETSPTRINDNGLSLPYYISSVDDLSSEREMPPWVVIASVLAELRDRLRTQSTVAPTRPFLDNLYRVLTWTRDLMPFSLFFQDAVVSPHRGGTYPLRWPPGEVIAKPWESNCPTFNNPFCRIPVSLERSVRAHWVPQKGDQGGTRPFRPGWTRYSISRHHACGILISMINGSSLLESRSHRL